MRAERSDAGRASGRGYPSPRAGGSVPAGRGTERSGRERPERERPRPERPARSGYASERRAPDRRAADPRDLDPRRASRHSGEFRRPAPPADARRPGSSAAGLTRTAPDSGPRFHGGLVVLGMFLLTLLAAAADSYFGPGLGLLTLLGLTAGTVVAALTVRRRDLLSVVVAPPLVFVAVAFVNIGLAPSASVNLPTLATLLVRGFPAMGIATGAAVLLWLFRWVSKR